MMTNKQYGMVALVATAVCAWALSARAQGTNVLVNDTWRAGNRITPAPPTFAENNGVTGFDADSDGDLSSAWFKAGSGNLAIVTNNAPITGPNILEGTTSTAGSAHWYTYFTQPLTPVTLSYPSTVSQEMQLTWVFTPTGIAPQNSNSGLTLALGLTPSGTRKTADASLPTANYTNAFAAFINMAPQFGTAGGLNMRKWTLAGSGSLAGTVGNYGSALASAGNGAFQTGYISGTNYTFVMDLDMTASGLQVTETMSGYNLNNTGSMSVTYTDPSYIGQSVSYDTFVIRPTSQSTTASAFDTSLFQVIIIPEPSTVALAAMGLGLALGLIRRRRS